MPCSPVSRPSSSSSGDTRMPTPARRIHQARNVNVNVAAPTAAMPTTWVTVRANPPPQKRPTSVAKKPTLSVPKIPPTRCTLTAPTGSSTLIFAKNSTEQIVSGPARSPMTTAPVTPTALQAAVMATSPVSVPLRIRLRSGFPRSAHATIVAATQAAAPDMLVFSAIRAIASGSAGIVLPALKANRGTKRTDVYGGPPPRQGALHPLAAPDEESGFLRAPDTPPPADPMPPPPSPNISANPASQNARDATANTTKFFARMLTAFFERQSPLSNIAKPAFMKNTRKAVTSTHMVSSATFVSAFMRTVIHRHARRLVY